MKSEQTGGQKFAGLLCQVLGVPFRLAGLLAVFYGTSLGLDAWWGAYVAMAVGAGILSLVLGRVMFLYGLLLRGKVRLERVGCTARWCVGYVVAGVGVSAGIAAGAALAIAVLGGRAYVPTLALVALGGVVICFLGAWFARREMRRCRGERVVAEEVSEDLV